MNESKRKHKLGTNSRRTMKNIWNTPGASLLNRNLTNVSLLCSHRVPCGLTISRIGALFQSKLVLVVGHWVTVPGMLPASSRASKVRGNAVFCSNTFYGPQSVTRWPLWTHILPFLDDLRSRSLSMSSRCLSNELCDNNGKAARMEGMSERLRANR